MTRQYLPPLILALITSPLLSCTKASSQAAQPAATSSPSPSRATSPSAPRSSAAAQTQDVGTPAGPHVLGPLSPQPGAQDDSIILLDPSDKQLSVWRDRDMSNDPKRDPGPISARGALSFFGLPIAVTPADLKAGKVQVAILGAAIDMGVGYRGAGEGPRAFRAYRGGGGNMQTMLNWRTELKAVDYGDAPIDPFSIERSVPSVRRLVKEIAETGAIPIIIGGDHSLEYPDVAGLADVYGKGNVSVIHFDSHYDAGDLRNGHLITHAQPVRRLVDDGWIRGRDYIQVGLRGGWPGADGFEWMRKNDFHYHTMTEIERDGWEKVMDRVLKEANGGQKQLHISFDIDVMDPAYTPGTGTPVPGGLLPREVFPLIRRLCAENNLVGFDLVELDPLVDPGYTTVLNSKEVVNQCLTGIAVRKKGLGKDYLSPLTVTDNRR
jgi:agmatinase